MVAPTLRNSRKNCNGLDDTYVKCVAVIQFLLFSLTRSARNNNKAVIINMTATKAILPIKEKR